MKKLPKEEQVLLEAAALIRKDVVRMIGVARSGHMASSLSIVDIMAWLYWKVLKTNSENRTGRSGQACFTKATVARLILRSANRGF